MEVTSDGWNVIDLKVFRLLYDHAPPRPYGYWEQFCIDARSWKPIALWAVGLGVMAVAVAIGRWPLLITGGVLIVGWCVMFTRTVRDLRNRRVAVGVIKTLSRHPLLPTYSTAEAKLRDGRRVPVAVETALVKEFLDAGEQAAVFLLDDQQSQYSLVIGARTAKQGR